MRHKRTTIIGGMIILNLLVTDLAAAYRTMGEFMVTLEATWMPGFERSYRRRQAEYVRALEKHEERGLFLRTLLKKPKMPHRPPPSYQRDTAARLDKAWLAVISGEPPSPTSTLLDLLLQTLDDRFYALQQVQLLPNMIAGLIVLGPPGVFLFAETGDGRSTAAPITAPETLQRVWQQTAAEIRDLLSGVVPADGAGTMPVNGGIFLAGPDEKSEAEEEQSAAVPCADEGAWRRWLLENELPALFDAETIFLCADTLLERHQEITKARTFSAASKAQALTKKEKDNLLRLAATL